jgi:DNA-binding protein YbaB
MKDIYTINAKLFDIDQKIMEDSLTRAFRFAKKHLDEQISLL